MAGNDWILIFLGALGFIVLSHQIPILRQLGSNKQISINNIEGIDLNALTICKEKGLI